MDSYVDGLMPYFTFKELDAQEFSFVKYRVSTRHGGVTQGKELGTLNMGSKTADTTQNIRENYKRFCNATGFEYKNVVLGNQTHSLNVRVVDMSDAGKGVFKERDYTDVDALITNVKNLSLAIHTADCVPVTLIDTENKAIGNAHCGWKGTLGELSVITLQKMTETYDTNPKDVVALIGPCIHKCCYEVSKDLYDTFYSKFGDDNLVFERNGKYYLDLPGLNQLSLKNIGVERVLKSEICTCCNKEDFYSHRGLGEKRGVFSTFVCLNE